MSLAKEKMSRIIQELPENSSLDEILRELIFFRMFERGLKDSRHDKTISSEEMKHRIQLRPESK